ncbi:type IV pilin protein [Candidatus Avelusimicrobium luingense]|uniref:type IV pilin protein n=1 Tax=Candidatus Avelusimicrobium luingense TaxID=3416211 RepID=UPI003D13125B
MNRKAFTLIELLVVVLIIGILASVALPQYQKAVEKSRATQALTLLKSLAQAQTVYFLSNGHYATSFSELDIEIPWTGNEKWFTNWITDTRSNGEWSVQIYQSNTETQLFVGRLKGRYAGAGFYLSLALNATSIANERTENDIFCGEVLSGETIAYNGPAGGYCKKLFGATLVQTNTSRIYKMP